jgi:hypothetical protein
MRALSFLDISNCRLTRGVLKESKTQYKKGYWGSKDEHYVHDMSGLIAVADVIPNMGAMTTLNLASNKLGVEGAKIIAACLPKCT